MPAQTAGTGPGLPRAMRALATLTAAAVMLSTGVAWSTMRSFEDGINHVNSAALGGGGEDGAIDILLVGVDSRTDAHGNPLSAEELATLRVGDDEIGRASCRERVSLNV